MEQSAALVEGKVTPRLAGLLDSIKDERKASLAVADPKLGIFLLASSMGDIQLLKTVQPAPSINYHNSPLKLCPILRRPTSIDQSEIISRP